MLTDRTYPDVVVWRHKQCGAAFCLDLSCEAWERMTYGGWGGPSAGDYCDWVIWWGLQQPHVLYDMMVRQKMGV